MVMEGSRRPYSKFNRGPVEKLPERVGFEEPSSSASSTGTASYGGKNRDMALAKYCLPTGLPSNHFK